MKRLIPALEWLSNYDRKDLSGDLAAGLIVAIMLIPQGMAYAMLAGLPPVMGLYASTIPLFVYALFGSSRHLAVGPVAMVSLLVLSGVSGLAEPGSKEYISLVLLLAFMVGSLQFAMGALRLGFLVAFLPQAMIGGFTSAAAIIIAFSQLKNLLGISLQESHLFLLLMEVIQRLGEIQPITFSIGVGSILLLVLFKKMVPKAPAPLVAVVLTSLIVYVLKLDTWGVSIVGEVPKGLPGLTIPTITGEAILALLPIALTISFIGFMESIAMGKAIAKRENYTLIPNQELIGLGLANIAGSFFSAFPVTGGFSRSAVNYQAGARTLLAAMITASLILLTLLFFTSLFYYLPHAVLAAIIMVAVYGLIDVKEAIHLFSISQTDGWIWLITFLATLLLGIEQGIFAGLVVSFILKQIWKGKSQVANESA